MRAWNPPPPPAGWRSVQPPFVARESELRTILSAWVDVSRGSLRGFVIGGEPGSGKSRLIAEAAGQLIRSGAAVFPGLPPSASDEPRHMKPPAGNVRKDLPSRYLFSRRDFPELRTLSPSELAYQVFFQMWQNKQAPYSQIEEGDVVYLGDTETRRIYWEVRVAALLHDGYASTADALDALWRSYGLAEDDLNELPDALEHDLDRRPRS